MYEPGFSLVWTFGAGLALVALFWPARWRRHRTGSVRRRARFWNEPEPTVSLAALGLGEKGRVLAISSLLKDSERYRLLDLGIVPGTIVVAERRAPGGDPTAYRIRGTLIALRRQQAELVQVTPPARALADDVA